MLAAGRGRRMGTLTADRPKCLSVLGRRTLFARATEALRAGGCTEIGVVTGYRSELLAPLADRQFHNPRWAATNMVASLFAAAEWLADAPIIVSYSDIFYTGETVATLAGARAELAVAYDPEWRGLWSERFVDPLSDAETFRLDLRKRVLEIGKRPSSLDEIEGQYMGLLKITPQAWRRITAAAELLPASRFERLDMTSLLSLMIEEGQEIIAVPCIGIWGECDSEGDLRLYEGWIRRGLLPS